MQKIDSIVCAGDDPDRYEVGKLCVTKIEYREHNYGDCAVGWFDVSYGNDMICSIQVKNVVAVHYQFGADQ